MSNSLSEIAVVLVSILFIIAYQFLLYIVDPEKSKGDISIEKMLKNVTTVTINT